MKIFITGFQRSGTTLLENLFSKHPDIKMMFHETAILARFGGLEGLYNTKTIPKSVLFNQKRRGKMYSSKPIPVDFDLKNDSWGEKIPFYNIAISKHKYKGKSITEYCKWWNDSFLPDAKIVYIIRHPIDVAISTKKIGYSKNLRLPSIKYKKAVPVVIRELKSFPNVVFVTYEQLVTNPRRTLRSLFKECNLRHSNQVIDTIVNSDIYWFGNINSSRAYNYRRQKANYSNLHVENVIEFLNKNVDIVNYTL